MKNIHEYLKKYSQQSTMRLMAIRAVNTACFVAVAAVFGAVAGVILALVLGRELVTIAAIIGGLLGGSAGIVGALLVPAFGGKAVQSFPENKNKPEDKTPEG